MRERCQLLRPYRVLDLGNEAGQLCGKILADLGADVIKVEPPGGDASRNIGPFYKDEVDPEKSLFWFAFNANKRGIILDLLTDEGQATLRKLVQTADFLVESFAPGFLDGIGMGYSELSAINPRLIFVSITPFGQNGPYRDYKACDLVIQALGGRIYEIGYPDRPPLRIGVPQAHLQSNLHAAVASLVALHQRRADGLGQHIDVSAQEAFARLISNQLLFWLYEQKRTPREGNRWPKGGVRWRGIWDCVDGEVSFGFYGGNFGRLCKPLVEWMIKEDVAPTVGRMDWEQLDTLSLTANQIAEMERDFESFFLKHTKSELSNWAIANGINVAPVNEPADIVKDEQLLATDFFCQVEHPEFGSSFVYPGTPYRFSATPIGRVRRAPHVGEHNLEVYSELAANGPPKQNIANALAVARRNETAAPSEEGPLSRIKVLDFTWWGAGPMITECIGDHGAQVVRVESSKAPDLIRAWAPYKDHKPGQDSALPFTLMNSSKLSIAVDLGNANGRAVARKLATWADVVVENFSPGTLGRWQLDYAELRKLNPSIIMLSSTAYGQNGPTGTTGEGLQARGGFVALTGWPDRPSSKPHKAYTDWIAPWYGVIAILAALDHRQRTGQGQYIDLSQYQAGLTFLSLALLDYSFNERNWAKRGNRSSRACPHGVYPCNGKDRWCAIGVFDEEQWASFCKVLQHPEWERDNRFATIEERKRNEQELDELVSKWTEQFTAEELMGRLQAAGVPAGVVNSEEDMLRDVQLKSREFFSMLDSFGKGPTLHYGWPYKFSRSQNKEKGAPCLGEHTHYVCTSLLGMSDEEFVGLLAEGVFV